jgi:hypothetical protein
MNEEAATLADEATYVLACFASSYVQLMRVLPRRASTAHDEEAKQANTYAASSSTNWCCSSTCTAFREARGETIACCCQLLLLSITLLHLMQLLNVHCVCT